MKLDRRQALALGAGAAALASQAACAQTSVAADSDPDLTGTSILITGCSSGFGRLGAEHYARLGAKVFATMRNLPRDEADQLRDLANTENLDLTVIEIDVTSDAQVEAGVAQALAATDGKLDVLVNNAGIGISGPVELQDMEATRLAFETNVFGCHRMVRAVLPAMRAAGRGLIIPISSQLGRLIVPGIGHYSATKFALESMSEQLAYELVPRGIDVTIVQPGGYPTKVWVNRNIYTRDLKDRSDAERLEGYPEFAPQMGEEDGSGRSADPMDVPRAIVELIAMPRGTRPLRRAVHPSYRPQEGVNEAMADAQLQFLGNTPVGPWITDVLTR
jgi:NAD(P)-dependent dehydrogenase (short-subunit alcohol dehydrogenase family)